MNAYIRSIGAYVPERRVTNDELAESIDTSDEWIRSHTGIKARHISAPDQSASDMAVEAARTAMERAGIGKEEIDLVVVATASGDYPGFPATASIVQHKLDLPKETGAFDLSAGCTGFVYGLQTAASFIAGGARNVLLIGVEALTKITNWNDRNTCVLFGDGAGAAIVSATESTEGPRIIDSLLRSDGSGAEYLMRRAGGSKQPLDFQNTPREHTFIEMNGRRVYSFAVKVNTEIINELLERNSMSFDQLKWVVPHQANERIIQAAANRLGYPIEKFYMNLQEYANTSAASIPIALNEIYEKELLSSGDYLLLVGFGAGLSYGGNIVRW
jgi:3-oxoacyl-[acyl-carrier-protein] synthase-3